MNLVLAILISQLGADSWSVRENASRTLAKLGPLAVVHLELAVESDDPEIRMRAGRLLEVQRRTWLDNLLARDQVPWLDALPPTFRFQRGGETLDRQDVLSAYVGCEPASANDAPPFEVYRAATRAWLRDAVEAGMTRAEVVEILAIMRARMALWTQQTGWPD